MGKHNSPIHPGELPLLNDKNWPRLKVDEPDKIKRDQERAIKIVGSCGSLKGNVLLCTATQQQFMVAELLKNKNITNVVELNASQTVFDILTGNSFDGVLVYDFLDHIPLRSHKPFIDDVIGATKKGSQIEILIHPWVSIDGGHDEQLRHFSHLVYDEVCNMFCARITDPIAYYKALFDSYNVTNYHYHGVDPDPWVVENILPAIASRIYQSTRSLAEVAHTISTKWIRYRLTS